MRHAGHPVLRWNFANVQIETDKAGNRTMHKGKSGNKIDGAVACAMAVARAAIGAEMSVYDADWYCEESRVGMICRTCVGRRGRNAEAVEDDR